MLELGLGRGEAEWLGGDWRIQLRLLCLVRRRAEKRQGGPSPQRLSGVAPVSPTTPPSSLPRLIGQDPAASISEHPADLHNCERAASSPGEAARRTPKVRRAVRRARRRATCGGAAFKLRSPEKPQSAVELSRLVRARGGRPSWMRAKGGQGRATTAASTWAESARGLHSPEDASPRFAPSRSLSNSTRDGANTCSGTQDSHVRDLQHTQLSISSRPR